MFPVANAVMYYSKIDDIDDMTTQQEQHSTHAINQQLVLLQDHFHLYISYSLARIKTPKS